MGIQTLKAGVMPMDKKVEADELLRRALEMAGAAMAKHGGCPPVLLAAGTHEGRDVVLFADMFASGAASQSTQERDAAWHLAKEAVKSVDAHAACSTLEVWMSIFPTGEDAVRKSLPAIQDQWPEWAIKKYRREALVFTLETPTSIAMYHRVIDRDPQGKAVLGELQDMQDDSPIGFAGRGTGLLYKQAAGQSSPLN